MVATTEYLSGGIILEVTSCLACGHVHLEGPSEFALLLHNVYRCISYSHKFTTIINVQGNLLAKWGVQLD